jgi:hypothetical protein
MTSWREIEQVLRRQAAPPPQPADVFWTDFKSRQPWHPQAVVAPVAVPFVVVRRLAFAACAAALALLLWHPWVLQGDLAGNAVLSLDVTARHQAVMMIQNASGPGNIVWVVCDKADDSSGGNGS